VRYMLQSVCAIKCVIVCHQRIRLLEEKVSNVTEELKATRQLEPVVSSDALEQLERRLWRAENELAAGDVLRDNLRSDREKVCLAFFLWCK